MWLAQRTRPHPRGGGRAAGSIGLPLEVVVVGETLLEHAMEEMVADA